MVLLREVSADDWPAWRELRLQALRDAPYAFSATLAEWSGAGDREERWRARLTEVPLNLVAELDGQPAGMVSATHPDAQGLVLLISMWVAPSARGCGIGDALIDAVIAWARERHATGVELDVYGSNPHALALYLRNAFVDCGPSDHDPNVEQRRMVYIVKP